MNIDELLQPISASAPCGEDLSFSADFDQRFFDQVGSSGMSAVTLLPGSAASSGKADA